MEVETDVCGVWGVDVDGELGVRSACGVSELSNIREQESRAAREVKGDCADDGILHSGRVKH